MRDEDDKWFIYILLFSMFLYVIGIATGYYLSYFLDPNRVDYVPIPGNYYLNVIDENTPDYREFREYMRRRDGDEHY